MASISNRGLLQLDKPREQKSHGRVAMHVAKRKSTSPGLQSARGTPALYTDIVQPLDRASEGEGRPVSQEPDDCEDSSGHADPDHDNRTMSTRASLLRLALLVLLYGTLWAGNRWGSPQDVFIENHPAGRFLRLLNWLFKSFGWLVTAGSWAILLMARGYRQSSLRENVNWRRHTGLDAILWALATVYWYMCVNTFHLVAGSIGECHLLDSSLLPRSTGPNSRDACLAVNGRWIPLDISGHAFLGSLGICLLLEELIRFVGEPTYYFTLHHQADPAMRRQIRKARGAWWAAVTVALAVVVAWSTLYVRTALHYHVLAEKVVGTIVGSLYWLLVLLTRYIMLYHISLPRPPLGSSLP